MTELKIVDSLLEQPGDASYKKMREDRLENATKNLWLGNKNASQKQLWALVKAYQREKALYDYAKKAGFVPHQFNDPDIYDDLGIQEAMSDNYEDILNELKLDPHFKG